MRSFLWIFGLLLTFWGATPIAAQESFWTQAMGMAPVAGQDIASARRQALAEALIVAGMAGGADIRGSTLVDKARVLHDRQIMRPTGQVHQFEVIQDKRDGKYWTIVLNALVGPNSGNICSQSRSYVVNVTRPKIQVSPRVPAWFDPFGNTLANEMLDRLEQHPNFTLKQVLNASDQTEMSAQRRSLDYTSLTQGVRISHVSDHRLDMVIDLSLDNRSFGNSYVVAQVDLWLRNGSDPASKQSFAKRFNLEGDFPFDRLSPSKRKSATDALSAALMADFSRTLQTWACQAPRTTLAWDGQNLMVNLGRDHGLEPHDLGFINSFSETLSPFEIVSLTDTRAVLAVIGGSDPQKFDGQSITFLKARLP